MVVGSVELSVGEVGESGVEVDIALNGVSQWVRMPLILTQVMV